MNRAPRLLALLVLLAAPAAARDVVVKVFHTNDIHGWAMPRHDAKGRMRGGAAALAALVKKEAGPKLVLDAGDWWQGTPEGTNSKGATMSEIFNAVGYDAVAVGNHDFDAGSGELEALILSLNMPALTANVVDEEGKARAWKPWIVKEVAGVKFGLFGLTTSSLPRIVSPSALDGLRVRREVDAAREAVKALKAEGAEVIVALTHVGFEEKGGPRFEGDQTLARLVPGIDLIVGGHTHTPLKKAYWDRKHRTLVVQAGSYLRAAGVTTLVIDSKTKRVRKSRDELVELDPARGEDAEVRRIVERQTRALGRGYDEVLARAARPLDRQADVESGVGSWATDCYREWAGADVAFQNGGGLRAALEAGPVTRRDIFEVMPFENALVRLRLSGALLRSALDHGMGARRLAQASGVAVDYRRPAKRGRRLRSVRVGGEPLAADRSYSVVTLDYLVDGGDGYAEFGRGEAIERTGKLARDVLADCARRQKTIAPPVPGRLILLGR